MVVITNILIISLSNCVFINFFLETYNEKLIKNRVLKKHILALKLL